MSGRFLAGLALVLLALGNPRAVAAQEVAVPPVVLAESGQARGLELRLELRAEGGPAEGDTEAPLLAWRVLGTGAFGSSHECPPVTGQELERSAVVLTVRATDLSGNSSCARWPLRPQGASPEDLRWLEISVDDGPPSEIRLLWGADDSSVWDYHDVQAQRDRAAGGARTISIQVAHPGFFALAPAGPPFADWAVESGLAPRLDQGQVLLINASDRLSEVASLEIGTRAVVPDVTGLGLADAADRLERRGLRMEVHGTGEHDAQAQVSSQEPRSGQPVLSGSAVVLDIGPLSTPVPTIVGLPLEEAERRLLAAELILGTVGPRIPDRSDAVVLEQEPGDGLEAERGSRVDVEVGAEVPAIVGLALDEAKRQLAELELVLGEVAPRPPRQPGAIVLEQSPPPGGRLTIDGAVDVTVGTAAPDVVGLDLRRAEATLAAAEFALGGVSPSFTDRSNAWVLSQQPVAGERLAIDSTVDLVVGVEVPDLIGLGLTAAQELLGATPLALGSIEPRRPDREGPVVIAQRPPAGVRVSAGATLGVTLGVVVPDLSDRRARELETILERVDLELGTVGGPSEAGAARVTSQQPAPGATIAMDSIVNVVLSRLVPVPDLIGTEASEVTRIVDESGLVLTGFSDEHAAGLHDQLLYENTVVLQSEPEGKLVALGSSIGVSIGRPFEIPPHDWPWVWILLLLVLLALLALKYKAKAAAGKPYRIELDLNLEARRIGEPEPEERGSGLEVRLQLARDPGTAEIESEGPLISEE